MLVIAGVTFEGAASAFLSRAPAVSAASGTRLWALRMVTHRMVTHGPIWPEFGAGRRCPVVGLQRCEQTGWTSVALLGFAAAAQPAPPPEIALDTRVMWLLTGDTEVAEEPTRTLRVRS